MARKVAIPGIQPTRIFYAALYMYVAARKSISAAVETFHEYVVCVARNANVARYKVCEDNYNSRVWLMMKFQEYFT